MESPDRNIGYLVSWLPGNGSFRGIQARDTGPCTGVLSLGRLHGASTTPLYGHHREVGEPRLTAHAGQNTETESMRSGTLSNLVSFTVFRFTPNCLFTHDQEK
ncbi:hypothetical protein RRG08_025889 [Elysia crispata]|uniref:Uncharacterized protein n=1 Tax=Elysia crispata TaxID=231223 RepID=A0AAE0ZQ33_9GAST|nr:hypothetical protein RRG08_025889 [Elysia crispata]